MSVSKWVVLDLELVPGTIGNCSVSCQFGFSTMLWYDHKPHPQSRNLVTLRGSFKISNEHPILLCESLGYFGT